jgi:hypothetical protein
MKVLKPNSVIIGQHYKFRYNQKPFEGIYEGIGIDGLHSFRNYSNSYTYGIGIKNIPKNIKKLNG